MRHLCDIIRRGFIPSTSPAKRAELRGIAIGVCLAWASSVAAQRVPATPQSSPATSGAVKVATPPAPVASAQGASDAYGVRAATAMRSAPGSGVIAELRGGANVIALAHERGWTRVRIEGWVPDSMLVPSDTAFRAGMSAADMRSDPAAARGKIVMWTVEFLALQTADPLRPGLADGEPYMLARGPGSENALLYLALPPSLVGTARALQPLSKLAVTARVRDGRSEPVGIPILDLQTIRRIR